MIIDHWMRVQSLDQNSNTRRTTRVLILRTEGEILQFLSTARETRYAISEIIFTIPAGGSRPLLHKHLDQTEHVEVISGNMLFHMKGIRSIYRAGEYVTIPMNTSHAFGNASKYDPLIARVRFEPAGNIEWYFTQMACSAIRNGGCWKDIPWLEAATIHWALRKKYRVCYIPPILQDLCFGALTLLAKLTGATKNIKPLSLYAAYVKR
ncbi:MAG: cupin domain-containing protein [Bacteroidota bacterium]|nr:cupin domain-containing protein [Bacteroidota bacterium]